MPDGRVTRRRNLGIMVAAAGQFPGDFPPLSAINRSFSENVIVKFLMKKTEYEFVWVSSPISPRNLGDQWKIGD